MENHGPVTGQIAWGGIGSFSWRTTAGKFIAPRSRNSPGFQKGFGKRWNGRASREKTKPKSIISNFSALGNGRFLKFRSLPGRGLRPFASRNGNQRQDRLPDCRGETRTRTNLAAGKRDRKCFSKQPARSWRVNHPDHPGIDHHHLGRNSSVRSIGSFPFGNLDMSDTEPPILVAGVESSGVARAYYLAEAGEKSRSWTKPHLARNAPAQLRTRLSPEPRPSAHRTGSRMLTLKGMLKPNSPFSVKFRRLAAGRLVFWRFLPSLQRKRHDGRARGLYPLLQSSMKLYRVRCWRRNGSNANGKTRDRSTLTRTDQTFDSYGKTNDMLTEKFGETAVRIKGKDGAELEPAQG